MEKKIIMLGSSHNTRKPGGIRAVINIYREHGLFGRWPIIFIGTHEWGGIARKLAVTSSALIKFVWLVVSQRVGVLHAHTASGASFWRKSIFMLIAKIAGVSVILHLHGGKFIDFYENSYLGIKKRYIRYIFDRVDCIVVLSEGWKSRLKTITKNNNIICIQNPVNIKRSGQCQYGFKEKKYLLFLGRMEESKGIYDLFLAHKKVLETHPEIKIKCGGHGNEKEIYRYLKAIGIESSVELLGWIEGRGKEKALSESMAFILPSYWEGLPISILEAMAVGKPIIATEIGGIPETVKNGVEGMLVKPGDVNGLTKAITEIVENNNLRVKMGMAAKEKVEKTFACDRVIPKIESLYHKYGIKPNKIS